MAVEQKQKEQLDTSVKLGNLDNTYAKINLTQGGALQSLVYGNKIIIDENQNYPYASSLLFPFANRVEKAKYTFNKTSYELETSAVDNVNAIHGLIYNKTFQVLDKNESSVKLVFNQTEKHKGYPFLYQILLAYTLKSNGLELQMDIKNLDSQSIPFSLGWHPYFSTSNLQESFLIMDTSKRFLVNEIMIPNGQEDIQWSNTNAIGDKSYDDCFELNTNQVILKTPDYQLKLTSQPKADYLQVYTPNDRNSIAIEPQTAPANSFNSQIGLQVIEPNATYTQKWLIEIK
ncbi:aldose 1-epimerase [Corallibacter sp.]|uniref:aldose 1-epimerase n=1 Tax=Corallibacter sp. TaxID=2038084 RepID=UPI003AB214FA